ncbi:MAG: hypothetical protein WB973_01940 [Thermoanaerobaculia bacterium]
MTKREDNVSKTSTSADQVSQDYDQIIQAIIRDAVAPPLDRFRDTASERIDRALKAVEGAKQALEESLARLAGSLGSEMEDRISTYRETLEDLVTAVDGATMRVEAVGAEAGAAAGKATAAELQTTLTHVRSEIARVSEEVTARSESLLSAVKPELAAHGKVLADHSARLGALQKASEKSLAKIDEIGDGLQTSISRTKSGVEGNLNGVGSRIGDLVVKRTDLLRIQADDYNNVLHRDLELRFTDIRDKLTNLHVVGERINAAVDGARSDIAAAAREAAAQGAVLKRQNIVFRRLVIAILVLVVLLVVVRVFG